MHFISEERGKKLHVRSIGTLQSHTMTAISLRKRMYCIECYENGIMLRGYIFNCLWIPYEHIIRMEYFRKKEFDNLYFSYVPRYFLKIICQDSNYPCEEKFLFFTHPYPFDDVFDHWNDRL